MGLLCVLLSICGVLLVACIVGQWDNRAAYRLLESSQHLFETGDDKEDEMAVGRKPPGARRRNYISPHMRNQVAASQHWRCRMCGRELDASFDLDHIIPLASKHWRGKDKGWNDRDNLQAICHSPCHIEKSAREASRAT